MAIAYRAGSSVAMDQRTNTVVNAPAGLTENDRLYAEFVSAAAAAVSVTLPSGWAQIDTTSTISYGGNQYRYQLFRYVAEATNPSSWTFTHSNAFTVVEAHAYSGVETEDVTPVVASGTGATATAAAVSPITPNCWLLIMSGDSGDGVARTPATGMTERADGVLYVQDQALTATGSTGTRTFASGNSSGATKPWRTVSVALRPASASPTTPTITTTSLGTVRQGTAVNVTLAATGSTPITWAVQSGSLPAGLSLDTSTGAITGTPTGAWNYSFTIRATNSAGFDDQDFSGYTMLPTETGTRSTGTTAGGTAYTRFTMTNSGDNAVAYVPTNKTLAVTATTMLFAHGADTSETWIDTSYLSGTLQHVLDKGWVAVSPNAGGNQFANTTARSAYLAALSAINAQWPIGELVWYGFSMGANAGMTFYVRNEIKNTYNLTRLVLVDMPWNVLWHWNNGSTWEHNLILAAYGGYNAAYDASSATYPASTYSGMKAYVSWSPDDTVAIATQDALAMMSYAASYGTFTSYQSTGDHESTQHFNTAGINAWLDSSGVSLSDNVGITDSMTKSIGYNRTVTNTVNVSDSVSKALVFTRNDAEGVTDAATLHRTLLTNNPLGLTDVVTLSRGYVRQVLDNLGLSDTANRLQGLSESDSVYLTEEAALVASLARALADQLNAEDAIRDEIGKGTNNNLGAQDVITWSMTLQRALSDAVSGSDAITVDLFGAGQANVSDSESLTDMVLAVLNRARNSADSVGISDFVTVMLLKAVADTVGLTDSASGAAESVFPDFLGVGDGITWAMGLQRGRNDSVGLSDVIVKTAHRERSVYDVVGLTDAITTSLIGPDGPSVPPHRIWVVPMRDNTWIVAQAENTFRVGKL